MELNKQKRRTNNIKHYQINAKELCDYLNLDSDKVDNINFYAPLSKKQEMFCNDYENDILVFGGQVGSGKTQVSILRMLIGVMSDPNYAACITRQSRVQLKGGGAIFPTATKVFESAAKASTNKQELSWSFPDGQEIKALHLWDNQNDYQGQQNTAYYCDEATQCKEEDIVYLLSRLRSKAKMAHQLILATNPLYESFLRVWLEKAGYLDEEGFCKKEMDSVPVYMARIDGEWVFKKTWEEMEDQYGADVANDAYRFIFYSAGVDDNPYIRRYLPGYIRKLDNLPELEKRMLRLGCWYCKPEASGWFKESWVRIIEPNQVPLGLKTVRSYDIAATLPDKQVNRNPDWTRGVKGCYDPDTATFYVLDMVSDRNRPAVIQKLIEDTAAKDGKSVYVALPKDPGASAVEALAGKIARLGKLGYRTLVSKTRKSKFERAEGFLIAAQNGQVVLVRGDWNKAFLEEWQGYDGIEKSNKKDDIVDATADCFNHLVNSMFIPVIKYNKKRATQMRGSTLI